MMSSKLLYHGSSHKLEGEFLLPRQPTDLGNRKANLYFGVYASDLKEHAISMALIHCKDVRGSSVKVNNGKVVTIVYDGWPDQDFIYLYELLCHSFKQTSKNSHQWVSKNPVNPLKLEKLEVAEHLHLLKKASGVEKEKWWKKYAEEIKRTKSK